MLIAESGVMFTPTDSCSRVIPDTSSVKAGVAVPIPSRLFVLFQCSPASAAKAPLPPLNWICPVLPAASAPEPVASDVHPAATHTLNAPAL